MSNHTPAEDDQQWWALSGPYPRVPGQAVPPASSTSSGASQQASQASTARSTPSIDESWNDRILRATGESLDGYISRLEAECVHHPRPARAAGQTKTEYADELWLRVYNKYCKRKSRANGNTNGKRQSSNTANHSRTAKKASARAVPVQSSTSTTLNQNSLLLQSFQPPASTGSGNGTTFADLPTPKARPVPLPPNLTRLPPNPLEGNAVASQVSASVGLQTHIKKRLQESATMEQYFRSCLDIPATGPVFDASTSRFHGNFSRIANFAGVHEGGATLTLCLRDLEIIPGGQDIDAQAALELGNFKAGPNSSFIQEDCQSSMLDYEQDLDMNDEE